jgi:putative membrane-bound dehydrogenase-like protein
MHARFAEVCQNGSLERLGPSSVSGGHPVLRLRRVAAILTTCLSLASCAEKAPPKNPYDTDPLEPAQALSSFQLVEGFGIELVASEPDVIDPVEMAFDENGDLYVVEMLDYPFDPPEGEAPRSRIRLLQDTDGDGQFETATLFADNLLQATCALPWKGGVFVTSAPDILYLKDTDGDHKADLREVVFTGFAGREVSAESRVTNLRLGIDNWIYAANNGRPGRITSPKWADQPAVIVRGHDFRFHPVKGLFEPATGPTQYGMSFDQWGNRFMSQNTIHLRHAVFPLRYQLNNPFFSLPSRLHDVSGHDPAASVIYPLTQPQQWRVERTQVRQQRYDETRPGRVEQVSGHFSAATGATAYVGDAFPAGGAFPAGYAGNVFVADANGNLVHRDILSADGVTFQAERWPADKEFLASTDIWFRPVNFANAPDGNLYIADFYREYIEEPISIPESIKKKVRIDFYRGGDRGRIYCIAPENPRRTGNLKPNLGQASTADLVQTLAHANGWHRRTAQRLLLERQNAETVPLLKDLAETGESPLARLHALWTLDGLDALEPAVVRQAMRDEEPRIREHAVRMAEGFLQELGSAAVARISDSDARVRFQVAMTLGKITGNHRPLAQLAASDGEDPWFRAAIVNAAGSRALQVLTRMLVRHREFFAEPAEGNREMVSQLARSIGVRGNSNDLTMLLITLDGSPILARPEWLQATLGGLAQGLARDPSKRIRVPSAEHVLTRLLTRSSAETRIATAEVARHLAFPEFTRMALVSARDEELPIEKRARAVAYLRGGSFGAVGPALQRILESAAPRPVQAAAIQTLATFDDPSVPGILLTGWGGYGPELRARAEQALLRRPAWVGAFLEAVESGAIEASSVDAVFRIRLSQYPDPEVKRRARELFRGQTSERAAIVESHKDALTLEASAPNGKVVFEKNCESCHLQQCGRGRIGPDLSGVNNKTHEELLAHILDPSFEIQPNYTNYVVVDKSGRVYDGLLAGESAHAITLRGEYEDVTIRRGEVAEMRASDVSLMPEGFEEDLSRQELADVIAYLRAGL